MKARTKRLLKKYWPFALGAVGAVLLVLTLWVFSLDRQIRQQFEGRRWTLPAKVYAQPLELYAGQALTADELQRELERLGYQRTSQLNRAGNFERSEARINLVSRPFRFADENRGQQTLSVRFAGNRIDRLWDARGQDVPVFRLDPLLIGSIYPTQGEDRIIVTPQETPALLPAALKIVEDRRFETHIGIDPRGIARAIWVDLKSGSFDQGGSTLTQQLVRSYFLNNRQTVSRKLTEAVMAILLEVHYEKADLMNAYINEINLAQDGGRAIHGFGLASQFYFGKPLAELQLHEIALLVTVVRGANYYNPRRNPERALARRILILDQLAKFNVASAEEVKRAKAKPLGLVSVAGKRSVYYPAFLDFVRRTLRRDYQEADLTEAGLTVFSTLDPKVQVAATAAVQKVIAERGVPARATDAATVIMAPDGRLRALVGGRDYQASQFNRAVKARRQPGSSFKPFIYLTALERGLKPDTQIDDKPVEVPAGTLVINAAASIADKSRCAPVWPSRATWRLCG
jgi:penicillin-binding protein 1B